MVKAWRETVVIPTYEIGAPEKNPIFLENYAKISRIAKNELFMSFSPQQR